MNKRDKYDACREVIREVTYEVRQGSVTCHDLSIYKQMYASKDKLITSY